MNFNRLVFAFSIALILFASACTTTFTKSGDYDAKPREPGCEFAVYTLVPSGPFREVGLITFKSIPPQSPKDAKKAAQEYVCKAGGNGLVLSPIDEKYGIYPRATVIWTEK